MQSMFWADQHARNIVRMFPDKKIYVCAAGITPSGRKHIGNFREIITVDLVVRALKEMGKKVRFIYSWDAFDRFRGIPKDLPENIKDKLKDEIGKPDSDVIDPWGCHESWARHWESFLEEECRMVGIRPKFIYQDKLFKKCHYWKEIREVMRKSEVIRNILNKSRKDPLPKNWYPLFVYCEECGKDFTNILDYDGNTTIRYECKCGFKNVIDFSKIGIVKPPWRVDWAMRWAHYDEAFEPGGKDHMVKGSSYDSSSQIIMEVFKKKPPYGFMYDFVLPKGRGGKMSASKGNVITVKDVIDIYTPEIVRFFFAGTKPNKEFTIPFDEEVLKIYEDFYWAERIYFKKERVNKRNQDKWSRVYELCQMNKVPRKLPEQPKFRYCVELINVSGGDVERALKKAKKFKDVKNIERWRAVLERAKFWVENYAPEKYRFELREPGRIELSEKERKAVNEMIKILPEGDVSEEELADKIYRLSKTYPDGTKEFFKLMYRILIGKDMGPRFALFLLSVGLRRVKKILKNA